MGGTCWNPLSQLLSPGERVVIKPNLVFHEHYRGGRLHGVVTDPRLIRAVADFVFRAIGREGRLVIGDAPLQSADWRALCERTGLSELPDYYARRGLHCELRDFRTIESTNYGGLKLGARGLTGDPAGYRVVDLGGASMHLGRDWRRFRVTNYDPSAMRAHHNETRHEYLVSASVLAATTVINISKLKTHRKCGLTGPLKNFVGINGCKDWLPHHTKGSVNSGGDEYAKPAVWKQISTWLVEREETASTESAKRAWNSLRRTVWIAGRGMASDLTWEGSWRGNDTLWRTILDLNRAALFADAEGVLRTAPQRKVLYVVDALLAGDGEGPMAPSPVPLGVLMGGVNGAATELAATRIAGWAKHRPPLVGRAFDPHTYPLAALGEDQVEIRAFEGDGVRLEPCPWEGFVHPFVPCSGWLAAHPAEAVVEEAHAS
jgi:uncharacterized protein (DUF362 family)